MGGGIDLAFQHLLSGCQRYTDHLTAKILTCLVHFLVDLGARPYNDPLALALGILLCLIDDLVGAFVCLREDLLDLLLSLSQDFLSTLFRKLFFVMSPLSSSQAIGDFRLALV